MSVWNSIQDRITERTMIEFELTEAEHRVVSALREEYLLEHVRVTLHEGQSPWEALVEAGRAFEMPKMKQAEEDLNITDQEAEAIEDASGQMGVEPPSRMKARKTMMDPKTALQVYQALQKQEPKYSAALGGPQPYAALMKKVVRQLRDKLGMGAKQLNPPTAPPVKDQTQQTSPSPEDAAARRKRVAAQDAAMMGGKTKPIGKVKVR